MRIQTKDIAQIFNREVIFKNVTLDLKAPDTIAVLGGNGSGKSTFLKILSGKSMPASGQITYETRGKKIAHEALYPHVSMCAPYLGIYEQLTLNELVAFHFKFKSTVKNLSKAAIPELLNLQAHADKNIEKYSSGMKQRVKLGLAVLSATPLLLLDEPFSNMDEANQKMMSDLILQHNTNRLTIICTNHQSNELQLCRRKINIEAYKQTL